MRVRSTLFAALAALAPFALILPVVSVNAEEEGVGVSPRSMVSTYDISEEGGAVTVRTVNRSFEFAGPGVIGHPEDEHLLLEKSIDLTETLGEKGMDGRVSVAAWPLRESRDFNPPLYTIAATGHAGAVLDGDLFVIERGLDEIPWQSVYALSDGLKLFDATSPWLRAASGGLWDERRYVALVQVFDDADDAALRDENAVALLTLAARERILNQVLIKATDPERARFLRSVWDQQVILSWLGGAEAKPLPEGAAPDPTTDKLSVLITFKPDGAAIRLPLSDTRFESGAATVPAGLSLEPYPPNLLLGRWKMKDANPAPWVDPGGNFQSVITPFIDKPIDVGPGEVTSGTPLACKGASYSSAMVPPEGLFQGGLASLNAEFYAEKLGLSAEGARTVSLTCDGGLYEFHFSDRDTVLLAYDNVVFKFSRAE